MVPARARDRNGLVPCPRRRDCRPRAGRARRARAPPIRLGAPSPAPAAAPARAPPAGGTTAGSADGPHTAAGPGHSPELLTTRYRPFGVFSRVMGALTGPEPAQGGPEPARQPGAANDHERAGSPARPRSGRRRAQRTEARRAWAKTEGQTRAGAARAGSRPGISPVSPRTAVPNQTPGMIEGHQGLISPFLTRDHEAGVNYGSICSIYPVRFAGSGTAVARLTRNHGPSVSGTFTRSGLSPGFGRAQRPKLRHSRRVRDNSKKRAARLAAGSPSGAGGAAGPRAAGHPPRGGGAGYATHPPFGMMVA